MNLAGKWLGRLLTVAAVGMVFLWPNATRAQSTNRQIGTSYTVTADPTVQRPNTTPCVVPLFTDYQFAHFSQSAQNFSFTPPSGCSGPWAKVVFEANFSENAGIQFDRTASVWVGNTNIYFGTTPEPLQTATNTWHVERDVTDYSALLTSGQQGSIVLANCTTDCGYPYNTFLNGVFTVSADLEFYPAPSSSAAPRTPDEVLPLEQTNGSGGVNMPGYLGSPASQLQTTFTLPSNVERAYLDVIAQSQYIDEQWYACFPNDLNNINELYGCGNTDFRDVEVTIDGKPAGIAPVSPWVFTGFLPDQWVPIPAAQTLDFVPYRVNLTPFAGLLSDGHAHTIALSVFNDDNYFSVAATLLVYRDHSSSQITGAVTQDTLASPNPRVVENLKGTSTVTGTIGVAVNRNFQIAGYIDTSHGRVMTSVSVEQRFASTQSIDFDTVNYTVLDQNTSVQNNVSSTTTTTGGEGTVTTKDNYSFPITVNVTYPVDTAYFGLTVATGQNYQANEGLETSSLVLKNGIVTGFTSTSNTVNGSDVSPLTSSQKYTSFSLYGPEYNCEIASENSVLTSVSSGCGASSEASAGASGIAPPGSAISRGIPGVVGNWVTNPLPRKH
jgi:hypothetical protein